MSKTKDDERTRSGRAGSGHGAITARGITKSYPSGQGEVEVLRGVDLDLDAGANMVILGPSGSGKSTLLYILGTLEQATAGSLSIDGQTPDSMTEAEIATFRNRTIGFVFQDHHLLPQYSVLQNVLLPVLADRGAGERDAEARARELIESVGLGGRAHHKPAQLSGGERQRAAIARSLINNPSTLLCDEPTGNLDRATASIVGDLLFSMSDREGSSLVVVTHSLELADRFSARYELIDGQLATGRSAAEASP